MNNRNKKIYLTKYLLTGAATLAIVVGGLAVGGDGHGVLGVGKAFAQQGSGGSGGGSGGGGGGGEGSGSGNGGSGGSGGENAGGQKGGSDAQAGRPSTAGEDSDGKGPQAGQAGKGDSGGKPGWAQEGIPEVELGRLSVARSPDKILAHALNETLTNWDPENASLYNMTAEEFADYVAANWDSVTIVDSPLENLALLGALYDGTLNLSDMGVTPASTTDLAAIFLGVASDKNLEISTDTVIALNVIMDLGLDSAEVEALATKAEDVREGVLEGHG